MLKYVTSSAVVGLIALSGFAAPEGKFRSSERPVVGQYIIVLEEDSPRARSLAQQLASEQGGVVEHVYEAALNGFSARMSETGARNLSGHPHVAYVEEDGYVQLVGTQSNATWGLDRVDARSGLDSSYTYNATGSGVNAYIIDTGIRFSHNDFGGRAVSGYDAVDGGTADDCNGHGTHVAGTVGGSEWGVAKDVRLIGVRVLDCGGSGTVSGVIAGVDWVTANHVKPAVANMSLGGGASDSLDAAVQNSIAAGVSYAIAAGNGNLIGIHQDACKTSPARVPEAITVSATDKSDKKASWANYGDCVDLFAPGVSITSAWYDSDSATNTISGTSMAAPHVAGAAALYLEANSGASPQIVRDAIYDASTKGIVTSSSTANNHLLYTLDFSSGGGGGTTNNPPTAAFSYTTSDLTADFTDESSDSDGSIASRAWDFGDGSTSVATNPSHTYAAEGTYTVTLTVTDDDGASASTSENVTVSAPAAGGISLSVVSYKVKGNHKADLSWSGATSSSVDIYRDGAIVAVTENDGAYTDHINRKGGGSYVYKLCEAGTSTCSNEAIASF